MYQLPVWEVFKWAGWHLEKKAGAFQCMHFGCWS